MDCRWSKEALAEEGDTKLCQRRTQIGFDLCLRTLRLIVKLSIPDKDLDSATLGTTVAGVPNEEHRRVMVDGNVRTGARREECVVKVWGTYRRDKLNNNRQGSRHSQQHTNLLRRRTQAWISLNCSFFKSWERSLPLVFYTFATTRQTTRMGCHCGSTSSGKRRITSQCGHNRHPGTLMLAPQPPQA